jgi:hypothetical protein
MNEPITITRHSVAQNFSIPVRFVTVEWVTELRRVREETERYRAVVDAALERQPGLGQVDLGLICALAMSPKAGIGSHEAATKDEALGASHANLQAITWLMHALLPCDVADCNMATTADCPEPLRPYIIRELVIAAASCTASTMSPALLTAIREGDSSFMAIDMATGEQHHSGPVYQFCALLFGVLTSRDKSDSARLADMMAALTPPETITVMSHGLRVLPLYLGVYAGGNARHLRDALFHLFDRLARFPKALAEGVACCREAAAATEQKAA